MARHAKVLVFVAFSALCAMTTVAAQGTTYTDPQGRYSFTVPAGWQQGSPSPNANLPAGTVIGGVFNAPAPLNGNFNVVTVIVPAGVNLDQVVTQSRAGVAKSLAGYQEGPGGIQSLTLGGQPARRYDYFLTPPQSGRLHGAQVITVQGNTVYVLTFTAAANDFNTVFQQGTTVLNSFTFLGTGGATVPTMPSTGMPAGAPRQGARELLAVLLGGTLIAAGSLLRRRYRPAGSAVV